MKNTNLMKSSSAVLAINIRFRIESIIFSRLKLFFWNMPAGFIKFIIILQNISNKNVYLRLRLARIITKANSFTRNVLKTFFTKGVLVREEARGRIPEKGLL